MAEKPPPLGDGERHTLFSKQEMKGFIGVGGKEASGGGVLANLAVLFGLSAVGANRTCAGGEDDTTKKVKISYQGRERLLMKIDIYVGDVITGNKL